MTLARIAPVLLALSLLPNSLPVREAPAFDNRPTVAILAFDNNTGKSDYEHLGQGMVAMLTTDLSAVDEIQLLERQRISEITEEINRQNSPRFDSTTAVKVGKLAGAQFVIVGSLLGVDPQMRIDTRVVSVETGAIVRTAKVTGKSDQFFDLEKRLARQLIDDLGVVLTPDGEARLAARQQANRVDDVDAIVRVSNAISLADAGDYGGATVRIAPVVARYPNSAFVKMTSDEIRKRAGKKTDEKTKNTINNLIRKKWPPFE